MMKNWQKMVDTRDYPITRGTQPRQSLIRDRDAECRQAALIELKKLEAQWNESRKEDRREFWRAFWRDILIMAAGLAAMGALALALWGGR